MSKQRELAKIQMRHLENLARAIVSNTDIKVVLGGGWAYDGKKNIVVVAPLKSEQNYDCAKGLLGHETGHAKYTDMKLFEAVVKKGDKLLRDCLNVVEDVFVENMMEKEYAGIHSFFQEAIDSLPYTEKMIAALPVWTRQLLYVYEKARGYKLAMGNFTHLDLFCKKINKIQTSGDKTTLAAAYELYEMLRDGFLEEKRRQAEEKAKKEAAKETAQEKAKQEQEKAQGEGDQGEGEEQEAQKEQGEAAQEPGKTEESEAEGEEPGSSSGEEDQGEGGEEQSKEENESSQGGEDSQDADDTEGEDEQESMTGAGEEQGEEETEDSEPLSIEIIQDTPKNPEGLKPEEEPEPFDYEAAEEEFRKLVLEFKGSDLWKEIAEEIKKNVDMKAVNKIHREGLNTVWIQASEQSKLYYWNRIGNDVKYPFEVGEPSETVQKMYAKLQALLYSQAQAHRQGGLKTGKVSGKSLYRAKAGNFNVFSKKLRGIDVTEFAIAIVIDCSGSMREHGKMIEARKTAMILGETLSRLGIRFAMYGFTASQKEDRIDAPLPDTPVQIVVKDFSEQWALKKKYVGWLRDTANNCDGGSLWAIYEKKLALVNAKHKFMMVVSDGNPRPEPWDVLLSTIAEIRNQGTEIVGIGVEHANITYFYDEEFSVQAAVADLPEKVAEVLQRIMFSRRR